jgi:hypothetical protein
LIDDTRVMLNSLQIWKVIHVWRKENGVAHRLTNEALSVMDEQVHMEEVPHCMLNIVAIDNSFQVHSH